MPELVECMRCQRRVVAQATRKLSGMVVCPACVGPMTEEIARAADLEKRVGKMAAEQKRLDKWNRELQDREATVYEEQRRLAAEKPAAEEPDAGELAKLWKGMASSLETISYLLIALLVLALLAAAGGCLSATGAFK